MPAIRARAWTETGSRGIECRRLPRSSGLPDCIGPSICADIYGLYRVAANVGDFEGARTEFLTIAPRSQVVERLRIPRSEPQTEFESVIAFIPLVTGPGVLANLLDVLRDAQLNMVSLISRPVKGRDGTYSFLYDARRGTVGRTVRERAGGDMRARRLGAHAGGLPARRA